MDFSFKPFQCSFLQLPGSMEGKRMHIADISVKGNENNEK